MNRLQPGFFNRWVGIAVHLWLLLTLAACGPAQPSPASPTAIPTEARPSQARPAPSGSTPALPGATPTETLPPAVSAATPVFVPPTPTGAANPAPTGAAAIPAGAPDDAPTPTLECQSGLRYLSDLTIPDGTQVTPGERIDKRWQVENNGGCNWDERYRLRRISGDALGAEGEQALYPARSGAPAVIQVLLIAPGEPGTYRSIWQAVDPQGQLFGDPITVEILVAASNP